MLKRFLISFPAAFIIIVLIVLSVLLLITPSAVFPDAAWGFQVLRSMQHGGGFNMLVTPDHTNIAKDNASFLAWWSPGQYLVPYLFVTAFKLNLGQAAAITTILCQALGLAGIYAFCRKAGFTQMVSVLSVAFIMLQQAFFTPYIFYNGGEVLLFAFAGWFLYGCISVRQADYKMILFVLLSGFIGFVCKSSFMWMYAAGLLTIGLQLSGSSRKVKAWLINGLWIAIPALVALFGIYFGYLSRGETPVSDTSGLKLSWETFSFPLASPLLSGFSFDDMANGLLFHNDTAIFTRPQALVIIVALAIISLTLIITLTKRVPSERYRRVLVVFYSVAVLFFGLQFLRQALVSYEARHFRIIGILITPGVFYLLSQARLAFRAGFAVLAMVIAYFSLQFYLTGYKSLRQEDPHGKSGIAQQFIDAGSLKYINDLDNRYRSAVFVFTSPDLGLEVTNNRVVTLPALGPEIAINFDQYVHRGHAGPLFILLPQKYVGVRANVILKCFPGYKGFTFKELGDEYLLYYATQAR